MTAQERMNQRYKDLYKFRKNRNWSCIENQQEIISTDDSVEKENKINRDEDRGTETYTSTQWLKVLKNDDLENTSTCEIVQSLRYGIPEEL